MRMVLHLSALVCLCVLCASGCRLFPDDGGAGGKSPLRPARPSPDSVTMEIIWARFPASDPQLNDAAWQDIDETQLAPAVRRELANNGFRVGVIGGTLPPAIARVLNQGESHSEKPSSDTEDQTIDLTAEPIVHGRVRQLPRNQRYEIQASEVYPSVPLLVSGGRELSGRTYQQAQAIYALRVDPQPDRTALVELTPELHHGSPSIRWTRGDDGSGILRQAPVRDHEIFTNLRMNVTLAPGEMLLLMSLPTPAAGSANTSTRWIPARAASRS